MSYIARLRGIVEEKGRDNVVVDVGGVGYEVNVPGSTLARIGAAGDQVTLFTYMYVREEALQLYGFLTPEEKDTFARLLGVTGIGPRSALSFLTQFSPGELSAVVERRDATALTRVKGIGRRTADRLILELQGKLNPSGADIPAFPATGGSIDPALDVLVSLGYSAAEAGMALARVSLPGQVGDEERVTQALRALDILRG
ncbi:MAG TPA: Holliday junction branch migration protein RuvA [Dehalococcoidia bacterium]|jgi:Holliday junction DNA helicase RuvA